MTVFSFLNIFENSHNEKIEFVIVSEVLYAEKDKFQKSEGNFWFQGVNIHLNIKMYILSICSLSQLNFH